MKFANALNHSRVMEPQGSQGFTPWEALVEPSRIYADPQDVLAASDLTREEKRAILASWASDVWSVESAPALRRCPGLPGCRVSLDEVLAALKALDPGQRESPSMGRSPQRRPIRWLSHGRSGRAR